MNKPTSLLRLGPLPKVALTRVTFSCTTALKEELERYAALHAQTYGEAIDAAALIPHMLAAFMERDRAFKRSSRQNRTAPPSQSAPAAPRPAAPAR